MKPQDKKALLSRVLNIATGLNALLPFFVAFVYTEVRAGIYALSGTLLVLMVALAYRNQKALRTAATTRTARYGVNAAVTTLLVVAIVVVFNFLSYNHPWKKDLTRGGIHTLSEQSVKVAKELKQDVELTAFVKAQQKEQIKEVVEKFRALTSKIKVDYVDPDRDPARARALNVKKYGTVIVKVGTKETRIDEISEEKFTNALIKLLQGKPQQVCFLTGHGERNADGADAEGYSQAKKDMASSSWETRTVNLLEETKVPDSCTILLVLGPNKAFFDKELTVLGQYLDGGGHALFALDPDLRSSEDRNKQVNKLLEAWGVKVAHNMVVDPLSRLMGAEASVPIVPTYNKDHSITKEFQATTLFPLSSSVEVQKTAPAGLKVTWLARSSPKSVGVTDFKSLASGKVQLDAASNTKGPLDMLVAVDGKKEGSKATQSTKLVVMGTSSLASNNFARHAQNSDLFLNSVSWLGDDESLISIRPKEEGGQAITLSQTEGRYIQLLSMVLVPLLTLGAGIGNWIRRRKL